MTQAKDNNASSDTLPIWWQQVPEDFRRRCQYKSIDAWVLSEAAKQLKELYIRRFGEDRVNQYIPEKNWKRAEFCCHRIPDNLTVLDIGSGLGEFVNLLATAHQPTAITSVDIKDCALWFDATGQVERIYQSVFDLSLKQAHDVVTCFEVIEHLPASQLREAVAIIRSLAKQKLLVSVPFMEPLPLYKGHFTRFDADLLKSLFPDAQFTIIGKGGKHKPLAWILCEIDTKTD